MDLEKIMISEMNQIQNAELTAKMKEQELVDKLMEKCNKIVKDIYYLKKYGFSFKISETDSYGERKPRVYLYHNNKYFCFLEASMKDGFDFVGNDLYRFLHPCIGGTCESFAKIMGKILMGK